MQRSSHCRPVASAAVIVVLAVLFLLSPRPKPDEYPGVSLNYIALTEHAGFVLNWDSPDFLALAREPQRLLNPREPRQSRPLYVIAAAGLARVVALVLPVHTSPSLLGAEYVAFVAINFLAVWLSMLGFQSLFRNSSWPLGVFLASTLLAANDVVKQFFWTPHTQMFNIFVPVYAMTLCDWLVSAPIVRARNLVLLGFCSGTLVLLYGSFAAVLPAVILALWFGRRLAWAELKSSAGSFAVVFLLPTIAWMLLVRAVTGEFYSHEVGKFRQFVWIVDFWRLGVLTKFGPFVAWVFVRSTIAALWFPCALAALATVAARQFGVTRVDVWREYRPILLAVLMTLVCLFPFFALLGTYATRLSWNFVPPVLAVALAAASMTRERVPVGAARWFDIVTVGIVLAWSACEVGKRGPWISLQ